MTAPFVLDNRLANDCVVVGDLPLSTVLLMNNSYFPWLILVPRVNSVTELFDLTAAQQQQLYAEITMVAARVKQATAAAKMNIANLGNVVAQLHIHVVARKVGDAAWPGPVWGKQVPSHGYSLEQINAQVQRWQQLLLK